MDTAKVPQQVLPPASVVPVAAKPIRKKMRDRMAGIASWYGQMLNGHPTASGEIFDPSKMTACHHSLPFGTLVRVFAPATGRSVVVKINDRGTLRPGRVIDLSNAAARSLGILRLGVARVQLEVLRGRDGTAMAPAF